MAVSLSIQDLLDYMGGTGAASPRTFYGLTVTDATLTSRALDPATLWFNRMVQQSTQDAQPDLSKKVALSRASQHLLQFLRILLMAGGKVNSYSIGNMSVTKQDLLSLLRESIEQEEATEGKLLALLLAAGSRKDQGDLLIEDPILGEDGIDRIHLDAPPFGGFV